jgi:hypothetical protein
LIKTAKREPALPETWYDFSQCLYINFLDKSGEGPSYASGKKEKNGSGQTGEF